MDLRIPSLRPRLLPRRNESADGITTNGWLVGTDVEGSDIKAIINVIPVFIRRY
jgi:hypothetical protein